MTLRYRYQNPTVGDTIRLKFDVYNSNNFSDVASVDKVEIYYLDKTAQTEANPDGRVLFATIFGSSVVHEDVGKYYVDVVTNAPSYMVGNYIDLWHVQFNPTEPTGQVDNFFTIFPELWFTTPIPIVYDFQFKFTPSRWRQGEKKSLQIDITPLVPRQSDLLRYYANIAVAADISVYIEQHCGECVPCEEDLRLIVDGDPVDYKEKCVGFYKWDTTDLPCGIYNVWAKMVFGDNIYIGDKQQLQLH